MSSSRRPELRLVYDLEGNPSGGVCSLCGRWMAQPTGNMPSKDAILLFAEAFEMHVGTAHSDEGTDS